MHLFKLSQQALVAFMLLLVGVAVPLNAAQAQALVRVTELEGVTQYRLPNGLQVLLLPDPAKGITTVNLTILAGSLHENYGETGMAHLLEHLIFKGSPTFPEPKMDMIRRGLRWNGTTSDDRTNYFASFTTSDENLSWYLQWQADALVKSNIARKDLDSEMTVVRNEFERGENNAEYMLLERMRSAAHQWHNYGKTTIGARSDIENVNIEHLRDFYRHYYQPDNAVLIITGSFDAAKTLAQIQATFGKIPKPQRQLAAHYTLDAAQDGERQVTVHRTGGSPMVAALYHTMPGAHPDFAAMRLLVSILGGEPQGRIYRSLSDKKLATTTLGLAFEQREPGAIVFGARLSAEMSVDAARTELLTVLDAAASGSDEITQQELEQAKLLAHAAYEHVLADPATISFGLSEAAATGDWRLLFLQRDRMEKVQLDDLRRVARQWLLPDNRTVGLYIPTAHPQRAPAPAFVDAQSQLIGYLGRQTLAGAQAFDPELSGLNAKVQTFTLDNGMKVALLPKESRGDKVRAVLALRYGTPESLAPLRATPLLALGMLDKGTKDVSRVALVFKALTLGVSGLEVSVGANFIHIAIQVSGDKITDITPLLIQVLRHPAFDEDEFEKLKAAHIAELQSQRGQPDVVAFNALDRLVNPYPADDIRSVQDIDTRIAQLRATTLSQVRDFHQVFFAASHAELVLVGAFDPALARQEIAKAFAAWNSTGAYAPIRYEHQPLEGSRTVLATPDKKSATYLADMQVPVGEQHADFVALQIANLSLRKRLWHRVREQQGLSYDVGSWLLFHPHDEASHWRIYASFAPQNLRSVETAIGDELAQLNAQGLSSQEVKEAVDQWLEGSKQERSDDKSLAYLIDDNLEKNRNFDWQARLEGQAKRLSNTEVNRVIALYLQPQKWSTVIAGDFASAK
ncbi:MAG: pitrilysin family protein [Betaproteobacteria bacterium]